jgi:ABC-type Fe3+-hydroxamate transport system substrate-binding protein
VSLVPSATETLLTWGVTPIAVTRFCEAPGLPAVGGTKNPDLNAITSLHPDLVVMCVEENRLEDAETLRDAGVPVHALDIRGVSEVGPELVLLAEAVGVDPSTVPVMLGPAPRQVTSVRAFVPIWRRPWMTMNGGCYGSSVLAHIGVENVFADALTRYPSVGSAEVADRAPELVLAPSEPYPFRDRHMGELKELAGGAPVELLDGKDLFWWGVRTAPALERLAGRLDEICATQSL